jgi:hypothetical protein
MESVWVARSAQVQFLSALSIRTINDKCGVGRAPAEDQAAKVPASLSLARPETTRTGDGAAWNWRCQ